MQRGGGMRQSCGRGILRICCFPRIAITHLVGSAPDQLTFTYKLIADSSPAAVPGRNICYHFFAARAPDPEKVDSNFRLAKIFRTKFLLSVCILLLSIALFYMSL